MLKLLSKDGLRQMSRLAAAIGAVGVLVMSGLCRSEARIAAETTVKRDSAAKVHITGTAVQRDGTAVANAEVSFYRLGSLPTDRELLRTVQTDQLGAFDLGEWPDLDAEFAVSSNRYLGVVRKVGLATMPFPVVPDVKEAARTKLVLPASAVLRGRVTDSSGEPVAGAKVSAFPDDLPDVRSSVTDADGRYEITDMAGLKAEYFKDRQEERPMSRFPLGVTHPAYGTKLLWYWKTPDEINIELDEPAIVRGTVAAPGGQLAAGIKVCLQMTTPANYNAPPAAALMAVTDADGEYRFCVQAEGTANIFVMNEKYTAAAIESVRLTGSNSTTVPEIELSEGGYVAGRVMDEATGKPIRLEPGDRLFINAHSSARPMSGAAVDTAVVQPDGSYRLRVPAGSCHPYFGGFGSRRGTKWELVSGSPTTSGSLREITITEGKVTSLDFKVRVRRN